MKKGYSGVAVLFKTNKIVRNSSNTTNNTDTKSSTTTSSNITTKKSVQSKLNFTSAKKPNATDTSNATTTGTPSTITTDSSTSTAMIPILNIMKHNEEKGCVGEGRLLTIEFPSFYFVTCYVPNSGQDLKRLDYRINEWDPFLQNYMSSLQTTKPVVLAGDLNVAHLDLDIYNYEAKHIVKQAGLTPQERKSFQSFLDKGFVDALRYFYPGNISY